MSAGQRQPIEYDRQVNYTMEPKQLEPGKPRGKCRKWLLRVSTGLNPRTGKYGERTKTFIGTYRQAKAALAEFADKVSNTEQTNPGRKLTFEELSAEYVQHRVDLRQIQPKTASKIKGNLKALSRHIGKMPADKLEPYMITDAIKAMMKGDSATGEPLSGTYINMILQAASTMYKNYAVPNGLASSNPFDVVDRPQDDTEERIPLSDDQQNKVMTFCTPDDRRHAAVMLALLAGLRRSETCNLLWSRTNLIDGVLMLPDTKRNGKLTATPIQEKLIAFLLEWKESQCMQMKKWGVIQNENMTVCANELGDPIDSQVLGRWWRRNRKKMDCEGVHFHDLRHTFATNLASKNIHPKTIQRLLRQKDDRVAMRIYTHVNTEQLEAAMSMLNNAK